MEQGCENHRAGPLRKECAVIDSYKRYDSLKREDGIRCQGKGKPFVVLPAPVSRGLMFLARNWTNNRRINKGERKMSEGKVKWFNDSKRKTRLIKP
jgi:hypothetical protein